MSYNIKIFFLLFSFLPLTSKAQSNNTCNLSFKSDRIDTLHKILVTVNQNNKEISKPADESFAILKNQSLSVRFYRKDILIKPINNIKIQNDTIILIDRNVIIDTIIVVTGKIITETTDGFIYRPSSDSAMQKLPIQFALQRIPGISLVNNTLVYKDNLKVKYLLNGKERKGVGDNWNTILKNIPTAKILKVELVTQLSVKDQGEGYSAVVNILTIDDNLNGFSIDGSITSDTRENINPSLRLLFLKKKSDISFTLNKNADDYNTLIKYKTFDRNLSLIKAQDSVVKRSKFYTTVSNFSYGLRVDSTHDFSFKIGYYESATKNDIINVYNTPLIRANNSLNSINRKLAFGLSYVITKNKKIENTIALEYLLENNAIDNFISFTTIKKSDSLQNKIESSPSFVAFKYSHLNNNFKNLKLETGIQTYFRKYNSNLSNTIYNTNGIIQQSKVTGDSIDLRQVSINPFISLSKKLEKKQFIRFTLFSEFFSIITKKDKNYFYLPEFKLNYNKQFTKSRTLNSTLSYSYDKPNFDYNNQIRLIDNPLYSHIGNVSLVPQKSVRLYSEYGKRKKFYFSHALNLSYSYDKIGFFNIYENNQFIGKSNNNQRTKFIGYFLRWQGSFANKFFFSIAPSVGLYNSSNKEFNTSYNTVFWSISSNANYDLKKYGQIGYNLFINGRNNNSQGYNYGTIMYSNYYQYRFYNKKLYVNIAIDNFLTDRRNAKSLNIFANIENKINTYIPNRLGSFTIGYSLNKIKISKISKTAHLDISDQIERLK